MSAFVAEVAAVAIFLMIGGDTEEAMRPHVWEMLGLCKVDAERAADTCDWSDASPQCKAREARNLPCKPDHGSALFYWERSQPEQSWEEQWGDMRACATDEKDTWRRHCVPRGYTGEGFLWQPKWVPSDQPTEHVDDEGHWMKLQL
jgi:hypothetical protein